ncbi:hypothetical protein BOX15_Mlig000236g2 [Macrostomum lignano]|uniref:Uncharacterized protein n=1 Tax=Macrostomum lignano TaxID=282301 RepID=A0A267H4Z1_9PLAT|nr:hypothetical protein BOX15_Mlig000236g2 [Macrostomum lignano]
MTHHDTKKPDSKALPNIFQQNDGDRRQAASLGENRQSARKYVDTESKKEPEVEFRSRQIERTGASKRGRKSRSRSRSASRLDEGAQSHNATADAGATPASKKAASPGENRRSTRKYVDTESRKEPEVEFRSRQIERTGASKRGRKSRSRSRSASRLDEGAQSHNATADAGATPASKKAASPGENRRSTGKSVDTESRKEPEVEFRSRQIERTGASKRGRKSRSRSRSASRLDEGAQSHNATADAGATPASKKAASPGENRRSTGKSVDTESRKEPEVEFRSRQIERTGASKRGRKSRSRSRSASRLDEGAQSHNATADAGATPASKKAASPGENRRSTGKSVDTESRKVCDRDGDATKARIDVAFDLVDDDSFVDKNLTVVDDILGGRLHSALRDIANTSILPEDAELEEEDGDEDYYLEEVWSDDLVPSQAKLKHEKKRHCCLFCGEMFSKIRRHLIRAHSKEMCVQRALAFNPKSDKYDQEFDRLRFRGDYEHNIKVMTQEKEGGIIVCRERSSSDMKDNEVSYLPCIHCFGFFRKTELSRHVQRCRFVVNVSDLNRRTEAVSAGRCLLLASCFPAKYPSKFIELINKMKVDSCSKVAQSDKLIMELGYYAYEGFTSGKTGKKIVTAKMREMSRLLMSAREIMGDPSACLDDLLKPSSFDLVVEATRNVAKFTAQEDAQICDSFSIPSMALKCGFSLKLAAELSLVRALKCEMPEVAQERRNFITLYETSWSRKISSIALLSLKERKIDKGQTLPLTSDIQLITKHINEYLSHIDTEKLKSSPSYWKEVAEYVAIRLSIFNKRRASEPFKLRVSAWQKARSCKDVDDTTLSALSELEKQMLYRLTIVNVRGKRAQRPVPLLVSNEIAEIIDELIRTRHHASSPYVFCSSGSLGYISPFVARTNVVSSCQGLQFPARLSSTNLRKYIATVSQILEMRENELGWLSNHLGHSLNVHHNFYRLHENTIELAKVGKLLLAIEAGRFDQLKGKTIEEIDVNDIEIDYDIDDKSDAKKDDLNESGDVEASIGSQARELKRGDQKSQAPPENNGARIQAKEFEDESIYHEGSVDFRGAPLSIKQVEKKKNRLAVLDSDEYESEVDKDDSDYQPTKKTRKVQKARANERRIRRTTKPKGATATTTNNKSEPGHGQEDPQKDKSEPGPGQEDPQKDKSEPGPGQEDPQKDKSEPGPGQEDPQKDKSAPSSEEVKKKTNSGAHCVEQRRK